MWFCEGHWFAANDARFNMIIWLIIVDLFEFSKSLAPTPCCFVSCSPAELPLQAWSFNSTLPIECKVRQRQVEFVVLVVYFCVAPSMLGAEPPKLANGLEYLPRLKDLWVEPWVALEFKRTWKTDAWLGPASARNKRLEIIACPIRSWKCLIVLCINIYIYKYSV